MKRKYEEENGIADAKTGSGKKSKKTVAPIAVQHKQLIVTSNVAGMNQQQVRAIPMAQSATTSTISYESFVQQQQQRRIRMQ